MRSILAGDVNKYSFFLIDRTILWMINLYMHGTTAATHVHLNKNRVVMPY